jgi:vacuolar-type H+-ATPase subunit H
MAHIAKYKATSVGHMLAHYRRDASSLERDNIDPSRVKNDLVVGHYTNKDGKLVVGRVRAREGEPNWGTVERRIERVNEAQKTAGKRATRKDAVVMADVVVTLPDNVRKGDEDRFFRLTYWYLSNKFGIDNMMGGYVHKDEVLKDGTPARDHMHVPFTPILDGRFNYKKMCPRSFYQSMHKELGDYLERRMGYRPAIELDEETRAQRVYTDKAVDIDKVRGAVDRAVVQPAEEEAARIVADAQARADALVRDAETRRDALVAQVADGERRLSDVRMQVDEEADRLECLRQRADGVARDVAELEPIAADVRRFEGAGRAERGAILDSIAARCDGLRGRVEQVVDGIRGAVGRAEMAIADLARKLGPRSARMTTRALKRDLAALEKDMSPRAQALEATRAARARNENRDDRPPQRSWGQSR